MGYDTVKKNNSEDIPLITIHKPSQGLSQQIITGKLTYCSIPGHSHVLLDRTPQETGNYPGPRPLELAGWSPPPPPTGGAWPYQPRGREHNLAASPGHVATGAGR